MANVPGWACLGQARLDTRSAFLLGSVLAAASSRSCSRVERYMNMIDDWSDSGLTPSWSCSRNGAAKSGCPRTLDDPFQYSPRMDAPPDEADLLAREPAVLTGALIGYCLLYTSPSPRDRPRSRMPS